MNGHDLIEKALLEIIKTAIKAHNEDDKSLHSVLAESDALLKSYIPYFCTPHERPKTPPAENGSAEFGILPYWAKMLPIWTEESKNGSKEHPLLSLIPKDVILLIAEMVKLDIIPAPTITDQEYNDLLDAIKAGTAIGPDGTIYGFDDFEQLNYNWLKAVVNGLLTKYHYHKAALFNKPDHLKKTLQDPACLAFSNTANCFAIAGDWGTAAKDAIDVRNSAMAAKPDYLIHLGDVYYTGTPRKKEGRLFWGHGTEKKHLVEFWPTEMPMGRSFTMNSNHEMYPGGSGLLEDALSSPAFAHQNRRSYFLLENDHWQIFALDSAYNSPDFLYMYGALNEEQIAFVEDKLDTSKKTILLTHHTPFDLTGTQEEKKDGVSLLQDVKTAFKNAKTASPSKKLPDYWYFGHIHDGIVYKDTALTEGCNMRCTGHASMPYGAPWGLAKPNAVPPFQKADFIDTVEFFAQTPKPGQPAGQQVMNGYMTFTLNGDQISEVFYDSDGTARWSSDPSIPVS